MKATKKIGLVLTLALMCVCVQTTTAQLRFGARGGVDVISSKVNGDILKVNNRMGYRLGMAMDFTVPIVGIGIESGLLFAQDRYKDEEHQWVGGHVSGKLTNYNYFTVPVLFKQKINILGLVGFYYKGGVYGNFRVSGGDLTLGDDKYTPQKFQKGLTAGIGVIALSRIELGLDYRHRLGSAYSSDLASKYNKLGRNNWTVTAAVYL